MRIADVFVAIKADRSEFNAAISGLDRQWADAAKNIGQMGRSLTTNVTLPILAAGGATSKLALDFGRTMGQLVGLAGVPEASINRITDSIKNLSRETGRGPQELAEAFYFVASAGFEADEAMEVLEVSARGSAAGLGQVQAVAQVLGGVINSYGKENLSAATAADILTRAVSEGAAEAETFAAVLPQVVPTAAQLGVSFEEVAGALAAMTTTGASASMSAVGLNQVFTTLLKPTTQANKTLAAFGLTAAGLRDTLESQGVVAVLRLLEQTFGDNEEAMTRVFGNVRAMRAAFSLLGLDAKQLDGIMASVADSGGAVDDAFAAIPDDVLAFDQALADLQVSAIELGADVLPTVVDIFKQIAGAVRGVADWWRHLNNDTKHLIINAALLAAALGPVLTAVSRLISLGRGGLFAVKGLVNGFFLLRDAIRNIPTALGYFDLAWATTKGVIATAIANIGTLAREAGIAGVALGAMWVAFKGGQHLEKELFPDGLTATWERVRAAQEAADVTNEEWRAGLEASGLEFHAFVNRVEQGIAAGKSWDEVIQELVAQHYRLTPAMREAAEETESFDRAMLQLASAAADAHGGVLVEFESMPGEITTIYEDGTVEISEAAGKLTDEQIAAAEEARKGVVEQMASMFESLLGLFADTDEIEQYWQDFLDRLEHPYTEHNRRIDIETRLAATALREALASQDPGLIADAIDRVNALIGQYETLEPGALAAGELVNPALQKGINTNLDALIDWIEKNVTHEALETLSLDEAKDIGIEGIYLYARGMYENRKEAERQAAVVAEQAKRSLDIDPTDVSRNVVQTYADGLRNNKDKADKAGDAVAAAARAAMGINLYGDGQRVGYSWADGLGSDSVLAEVMRQAETVAGKAGLSLRGLSPPKEGPLKDIDKDAMRIGLAWAKGLPLAAAEAARQAGVLASSAFGVLTQQPAMAGLGPMASSAMTGLTPGTPAGSGGNTYQWILQVGGKERVFRTRDDFMAALDDLGRFGDGVLNHG